MLVSTDSNGRHTRTCRTEIVLWVLVFVWLCVIFFFSAQGGTSSGGFSAIFARMIARLFTPGFDSLSLADQASAISSYQFLVRKSGHFCVYAALGIFFLNALRYTYSRHTHTSAAKHVWLRLMGAAWLFCALYATSDEIHQLFVPGRSGLPTDVMIDSCGALVGIILLWLIIRRHGLSAAGDAR